MRWFLVLFILCACAPSVAEPERVQASLPFTQVSFYPLEAGVVWEYLEAGERLDAPRLFRENLGYAHLDGQRYSLVRSFGRGGDTLLYYLADGSGVQLAREERSDMIFVYDPPMRVLSFTDEGELAETWSGRSDVLTFSNDRELDPTTLEYQYSVVTRRPVIIEGETLEAAILSQQVVSETSQGRRQHNANSWFVPFYGEVRIPSGGVLVSTNLPMPRQVGRE